MISLSYWKDWLQGSDLNWRPSGYEPKKTGGFLPTNRGGGHMVDNANKPDTVVETWWTTQLFSLEFIESFKAKPRQYRHIEDVLISVRQCGNDVKTSLSKFRVNPCKHTWRQNSHSYYLIFPRPLRWQNHDQLPLGSCWAAVFIISPMAFSRHALSCLQRCQYFLASFAQSLISSTWYLPLNSYMNSHFRSVGWY